MPSISREATSLNCPCSIPNGLLEKNVQPSERPIHGLSCFFIFPSLPPNAQLSKHAIADIPYFCLFLSVLPGTRSLLHHTHRFFYSHACLSLVSGTHHNLAHYLRLSSSHPIPTNYKPTRCLLSSSSKHDLKI